jgi:enoyl-CoA hydratase/carnithine racemase
MRTPGFAAKRPVPRSRSGIDDCDQCSLACGAPVRECRRGRSRGAALGLARCGSVTWWHWKGAEWRMAVIEIDYRADVAEVRLNRPDKRNALSFALLRELVACARMLRKRRDVRAVILCGAGECFSSGIDLQDLSDPKHRWLALWSLLRPGQNLFQRACLIWRDLPMPVIAAIHGHCYGAGMQLALGADIRIARPDAQLSIMEGRWGLVPDMGLSRSLRGLMRADRARELVYSARIIDGTEAERVGLVTRTADDPLAAAMALAREIATRSPDAVLAAKRVLDAMNASVAQGLRAEKRWQLRLMRGRNVTVARKRAKSPELPYLPRQYD